MNILKKYLGNLFSTLAFLLSLAFSFTCPACLLFPVLVGIGATSMAAYASILTKGLLITLILIAILSFIWKYNKHKNPTPILFSIIGGSLIYYFTIINNSKLGMRTGAAMMFLAAISDLILKNKKNKKGCCKK